MKTLHKDGAEIYVCHSLGEFETTAAQHFVDVVSATLKQNNLCSVALSGGSTPSLLYSRLLQDDFKSAVDWSKVHFFVSDERAVPLDSSQSNFGKAQREFLNFIELPDGNLHPLIDPDKSPEQAARAYEREIKEFFSLVDGAFPPFDLLLLGMGPDGHTASLFPNTKALQERERIVVENSVGVVQTNRITFTFPALNAGRNVLILVQGKEKAPVIAEIFLQQAGLLYPIQQVSPPNGKIEWILDASAGSELINH